jgi:hypothetical protein
MIAMVIANHEDRIPMKDKENLDDGDCQSQGIWETRRI